MDIFKARSYKQNIKSKSRQSETLVIQKTEFFDAIKKMSIRPKNENGEEDVPTIAFTETEMKDIEACI